MPRDPREVVAASGAYAVGSHFRLDMALRSAHDVASWLDERETFKATSAIAHAVALGIALGAAVQSSRPGVIAHSRRQLVAPRRCRV